MTATSKALKEIFTAARPLIEQWLDVAEQMAAIRDTASAKGLDWSQIKALLKAQVQDERDGKGDGRRVKRIVDKAEFASAYADMLGLVNMNEENFSLETHSTAAIEPHAVDSAGAGVAAASSVPASSFVSDDPDAGNLTASPSSPLEGSGFHDSVTGEVFDDPDLTSRAAEFVLQMTALGYHDISDIAVNGVHIDEPEQPLTEAPPSPYPSVEEGGGAKSPGPASEPYATGGIVAFDVKAFAADLRDIDREAFVPLADTPNGGIDPLTIPDFLRRNKQQAVA